MKLYDSIYEYGEAEYVIQKSRFIAHASPVASYDEARDFLSMIREEYRDATHNVPAVIVGPGQETQWASDDGEPSGTSGLPLLKMLAGEGLTYLAVVVTRYFGGIKLGTGGLARAYQAAGRLGIEAAGICEIHEGALMRFEFDYTYLSKLQNLASEGRFELSEPEFSEVVRANLSCPSETADEIKYLVSNLTNGRAKLLYEEKNNIRIKK